MVAMSAVEVLAAELPVCSSRLAVSDLVDLLACRARCDGSRVAVRFLVDGECQEDTITYAQLHARAWRGADQLLMHARPGDRALLVFGSGIDYAVAFFACLAAGVVAVPVFPPERSGPNHVSRLLAIARDAEPALCLGSAESLAALSTGWFEGDGPLMLVTDGWRHVGQGAQEQDAPTELGGPGPDALAFLQYTSGSTARPKGVMVTHGNLLANLRALCDTLVDGLGDRAVSWLPLHHDMGLICGLLMPIFAGIELTLMSPEAFLTKPARWLEAVARAGRCISGGPDFAYRLCAERVPDDVRASLDLSGWHRAFNAAEPIRADTLRGFADRFAACGFDPVAWLPAYGLAETTLLVSAQAAHGGQPIQAFDAMLLEQGRVVPVAEGAKADAPQSRELIDCGPVVAGHAVRIVDPESGCVLEAGRTGEIWVSGPSVTLGFWRQPEATAAAWIPALLDGTPGPWLRTGDLGFLHEGHLFISSRLKDLLIIRGRNLYPQDVEHAVEQIAGVRRGRLAAFAVPVGGRDGIGLAIELRGAGLEAGQADTLFSEVAQVVAQAFHEPVAAIMLLAAGSLPKTSSGKVQRAACLAQWMDGAKQAMATFDAARGDPLPLLGQPPLEGLEQDLASLWCEVLDAAFVSREANFFALGGQSLSAVRLAALVARRFGARFSASDVFIAPTLADMAARIASAQPAAALLSATVATGHALERAPDGQALPLSFAQQRLWFLDQLEDDTAFYNIALAVDLRGQLALPALQWALEQLHARHEALRTTFHGEGTQTWQRIEDTYPIALTVTDVTEQAATLARSMVQADAQASFDLARVPLTKTRVLRHGEAHHTLLWVFHHISVDGWSVNVLLRELAALYTARVQGAQKSNLPALPCRYADHAWSQRRFLDQTRLDGLLAYWRTHLEGAPSLLTLAADHRRPPVQSHRGRSHRFQIGAALVDRVQAHCQAQGATLFMGLLTAFNAVLYQFSGKTDLVVGTDTAQRDQPELAPLVGFFVNQLALRTTFSASDSLGELLGRVRAVLLPAFDHQALPFDLLVQALRPTRELSHAPVFQVKLVLQDAPQSRFELDGLVMSGQAIDKHTAEMDIVLDLMRTPDGLDARLEYATDLFEAHTIERFVACFQDALNALLKSSVGSIRDWALAWQVLEQAQARDALNRLQSTHAAQLKGRRRVSASPLSPQKVEQ